MRKDSEATKPPKATARRAPQGPYARNGNNKAFIAWRKRNGLTLDAAAAALGLSRRTMAYYSKGNRPVPDHVILACTGWETERLRAILVHSSIPKLGRAPARDSHDVAERARLLSHMSYVDDIQKDPGLVHRAAQHTEKAIERGDATVGERLWYYVFTHRPDDMIELMIADTEAGRLLRSNSPFSRMIGIRDPQVRDIVWKIAKAGA
jgi:hypothetical protein